MEIDAIIGAVIVPAAVAAALLFALRTARARVQWLGSTTPPALALALATVLASRHQFSGLFWPPRIALESLPWVVACAALVASVVREVVPSRGLSPRPQPLDASNGAPKSTQDSAQGSTQDNPRDSAADNASDTRSASAIAAVVTCVVALFLLKLPAGDAATRIAFTGLVAMAAASAALTFRRAGPGCAIAMWGSAACMAGLAVMASLAKVSLVLGAFSATAAAIAVLAAVQRPLLLGAPGAALWATVLGATAMLGMSYDEAGLPPVVWWLAGTSPLAACIGLVPRIARRPRTAAVVRVGAPIALALIAVIIAGVTLARHAADQPESPAPSYDQYGLATPR